MLGPDLIARGAASAVRGRAVRWMLTRPRTVRRSYVREVMDRPSGGDEELAQQIWMLRQPTIVRESYINRVLSIDGDPPPQVAWMLRQPDATRESYLVEVLGAEPKTGR